MPVQPIHENECAEVSLTEITFFIHMQSLFSSHHKILFGLALIKKGENDGLKDKTSEWDE